MKYLIAITIMFISSLHLLGQEANILIDKKSYKFDEIIELTFEINAKSDSIGLPSFSQLKLIGGPSKSSSISIKNGEKTVRESISYTFRPDVSGKVEIKSPTYFIENKEIIGESVWIEIDPSNLSAEELEEKRVKEFIEDAFKPSGTTRIIIHDNMGYVEVFSNMSWHIQKILTTEEIEKIKEIK